MGCGSLGLWGFRLTGDDRSGRNLGCATESLASWERVFRQPFRTFLPHRASVCEGSGDRQGNYIVISSIEALSDVCLSLNVISPEKVQHLLWNANYKYPVHRIRMWKMRNAYIILVDKPEGKIPFVRPSRVCLLQVKWDDKEYGPVFNDTFLSAVFKLQDQIQKVQREWQPLMALYHHQSVTLITTLIRPLNKGQSHLNQWSRSGLRCWNSYQPTMAVVPGSLVDIDRTFREASVIIYQTTRCKFHKTVIFIHVAMRIWDFSYQL